MYSIEVFRTVSIHPRFGVRQEPIVGQLGSEGEN